MSLYVVGQQGDDAQSERLKDRTMFTLSRLHKSLVAASLLLFAGPAMADTPQKKRPPIVAASLGGVSAPNVRLAAVISNSGQPIRSKGVASVTHPKTGVFCVQPSFAVQLNQVVPSLTPDFSLSPDQFVFANYASNSSSCSNSITVLTFTISFGRLTSADEAFTIIVP
jgi:hypothetical protein